MLDLDAIEAALAKMTPGPWHSEELVLEYETHGYDVTGHDGADLSGVRGMFNERPDAAGIVVLRNTAREMIADLRRLRKLCGEAANSIADANIKSSLVDRLSAASKGEL